MIYLVYLYDKLRHWMIGYNFMTKIIFTKVVCVE